MELTKVDSMIEALTTLRTRCTGFLQPFQSTSAIKSVKSLEKIIDFNAEMAGLALPKKLTNDFKIQIHIDAMS